MATVRLVLYDHEGAEVACNDIAGETLLDAATDATLRGMETDMDFNVIEPEGAPLAIYWSGRKEQKCNRTATRAISRRERNLT